MRKLSAAVSLAVVVAALALWSPAIKMVAFAAPGVDLFDANVGNGFGCGPNQGIVRCVGVTTNAGGSFWAQTATNGTGFIEFYNVLNLGPATITHVSQSSAVNPTTVSVTFTGTQDDLDGGGYSGTATFTFQYFAAPKVGSGRGGGYPRPTVSMTSGKFEISYN